MADRIPKVNASDVLRVIKRDFPDCESEDIIGMLGKYTAKEPSRVHLAALKLSEGHIEKLRRYIQVAILDFRDVISPAEYPKFHDVGFGSLNQLNEKEIEKMKKADWNQYQEWLTKAL